MSVRLDDDVREWISILKDQLNLPNVSEVVRHSIKKAYPNIEQVVDEAHRRNQKIQELLEDDKDQ